MKIFKIATALVLLGVGAAYGEKALPPPKWPTSGLKPSNTKVVPVTGMTLGAFRVAMEKTTFRDVAGVLGTAPVGQQGDAGAFLKWVCYTIPTVHARVWFGSGEIGEGKYIDQFSARQIQPEDAGTAQCPVATSHATILSVDHNIWLGESVEKIKSILGAANNAPASLLYYQNLGKDGEFDVTSTLVLKIENGKVTELHGAHVTTN